MSEWHLIKTLPKFYKNETDAVEVMLKNELREVGRFVKKDNGDIIFDTGYMTLDLIRIVKWRNIDLF